MTLAIHPTAPLGLAMAAAGTVLVWSTRQGTPAAAAVGFLVAALASAAFGAGAFLPLAIFVLGSGALTRIGRPAKERMLAAEAHQGRRGAANAAAKLALPAIAAGLAIAGAAPVEALALAYVASIAGAFADTAATEVGPVAGGAVFALDGGRVRSVAHGTPGGMSAAGLLAGTAAPALIAGAAYACGLLSGRAAIAAFAAGDLAGILESLLARTAVGRLAGHYGRNILLSLTSAGMALTARAAGWISR
jgi:uncharacterized protein (TIGR00297 family)